MFEFCDYLDWAYFSGISLSDSATLGTIRATNCAAWRATQLQTMHESSQADQNIFSTTFVSQVSELVAQLSAQTDIEQTSHFKYLQRRAERNHELRTNVKADAESTVFFNYQAFDQTTLSVYVQDLLNSADLEAKFGSANPFLPPSS